MASIKAVVSTKAATYPVGTVEGTFDFSLVDTSGTVLEVQSISVPVAQFDNVAPGTYTVSVTKNGVTASTSVFIPVPDITINVPDTIVVTVA